MKFKDYQQLTKRTLPQLHSLYYTSLSEGMGQSATVHYVGKMSFYIPEKKRKLDTGEVVIDKPSTFIPLPEILNLMHMNLGMVSEINELVDAIEKKDSINIAEELSDQLWYIANDLTVNLKAGLIDQGTYDHFSKTEFGIRIEATDGGFNEDKSVQFYKDRALMADIYNASKLADLNKKLMAYGKMPNPLDYSKIVKYLLAAINNLAIAFNIDLELAMANNIAKLQIRFPDKFDAVQAVNRDLSAERSALEQQGRVSEKPNSIP